MQIHFGASYVTRNKQKANSTAIKNLNEGKRVALVGLATEHAGKKELWLVGTDQDADTLAQFTQASQDYSELIKRVPPHDHLLVFQYHPVSERRNEATANLQKVLDQAEKLDTP